MADLRSPERTWEDFFLFLCLLSLGNRGKMSTDASRNTHTHIHTHGQDLQWWVRGGGAIGSQKVYVTPDSRDRSLKAWHELHTHAQRGSFSSALTALFCSLLAQCCHGGSAPISNTQPRRFCAVQHTKNKFGQTERVPRPSFVVQLSTAIRQNQQTLIISGNAIRHRPGLQ